VAGQSGRTLPLDPSDRRRFDIGFRRVYIDIYAAIPPQFVRRLIALHDSGVLTTLELGENYHSDKSDDGVTLTIDGNRENGATLTEY